MSNPDSLALIAQMIEAAEKNIQSAKHLLKEALGNTPMAKSSVNFAERANSLAVSDGGKIIEGVFDGQNMIGPDNKQYPVPANYASKSKLVEGDVLKLTINDDGSFIYKQIGPIERKKIVGILMQDEKGDYKVIAEGKTYKVLLASLTYFKAESGDEVTIVVPEEGESEWAAVEHVIKSGPLAGGEQAVDASMMMSGSSAPEDEEVEMSPIDMDDAQDELSTDEDFLAEDEFSDSAPEEF
ncbi:MAG: hypothetical protein R3B41_01690 [Candidatus Doudnabacteria bacterium]